MGKGGYQIEAEVTKNMDYESAVDTSWIGKISTMFFPSFNGSGQSVIQLEAARRMSQIAFNLYEAKAKNGAFPETAGNTSRDPFSGNPFIYKRERNGFRLYSVGGNLVDDGGLPNSPGSPRTDDIEFGYTRQP